MLSRAGTMLALVFAVIAFATAPVLAIPQLINYEGVLTDGSGTPITIPTNVQFRIYDAAAGGTEEWAEAQSVTPDANGRFSVLLGSVNPVPDTALDQADAFLGLTISPDPEMTPRTRLVAVAYAFRPGTVDGATGGTISGDVAVSGGNFELDSSSATAGNIMKGGTLFIHNGDESTFIGRGAGNLTMTGYGNTGTGVVALKSITSGTYNNAYGAFALFSSTVGHSNNAYGSSALQSNTSGGRNSAYGDEAMRDNTTGNENCAFGAFALRESTTGDRNCAYGSFALSQNTTGSFNSAYGKSALSSNTVGANNSAFGHDALLLNTSGANNNAFGKGALRLSVTGSDNTAFGDSALLSNTTSGSAAFGARALKLNTSGSNNVAFGTEALENNATGNGNTGGGFQALRSNTSGGANTALGYNALGTTTTGGGNTACGNDALSSNTSGTGNTALGYNTDVSAGNLTNATVIGADATVDASNKIRLGNSLVTVLECQVGLTVVSDENQKENFRPVDGDDVLRKIRDLDLPSWNFKGHEAEQFRHYGPMAQDFFAAFGQDEVGTIGTPTTINSSDMSGILMIAVQALVRQNGELKDRVETLERLMQSED